jgi:hypothetical protein
LQLENLEVIVYQSLNTYLIFPIDPPPYIPAIKEFILSMRVLSNLKEETSLGFDAKGLVLLDNLCFLSFFPLLKASLRLRPVEIYYLRATAMGLRIAAWLKTFRIISKAPIKIDDLYLNDTRENAYLINMFKSAKICLKNQDRINKLVDKCIPKYDSYFQQVCAVGVRKEWELWVESILSQLNFARALARKKKIPTHHVVFISHFASIIKVLNIETEISSNIKIYPQPFENKAQLYLWGPVLDNIFQAIRSSLKLLFLFKKEMPVAKKTKPVVGVTAAWGVGIEGSDKSLSDDFFWWRQTKIPPEQLICMFDRRNFQPTQDRLIDLENLRIPSIVLDPKYPGAIPRAGIRHQKFSFVKSLKTCFFYSKLAWRGLLSDGFNRSVFSLVSWQIYKSEKLVPLYKNAHLRAVFHIHEPGLEFVNLAALNSNAMRIGTHWSCMSAPCIATPKCHEVFFVWGEHDLKIILDSGSISKNILISGCILSEKSHKEELEKGREEVQSIKNHGARFILALFDNSFPLPNFYRFFLQWLVDDPTLGLLIKSKGKCWDIIKKDGLECLVEQALKTGRLYVLDPAASPQDAGLLADFSVGTNSVSAIAVAAMQGARVLYLDYDKQDDQEDLKTYATFHSLGPNRCVFYDPESLKKSVLEHINNPESNPCLGDASPILDQLDPFRDGKASQRIGEYVTWYLEGLDQSLSKESAIRNATAKYANKWGAGKVIGNR